MVIFYYIDRKMQFPHVFLRGLDGLGILICKCVTCRWILDLKKVLYRRIQILMAAAILSR
jgi:hypothetical protein